MFTYTGQGSLQLGGCSTYYLIIKVPYKYVPGTVTYYKPKAEQGKLEKIVVKKVQVVRNSPTEGQYVFMYIDTLNSIYNEYDLILEPEALFLIKIYIERQIQIYKAALQRCRTW